MIKLIFPLSIFALHFSFSAFFSSSSLYQENDIIIDSDYNINEALAGLEFPEEVRRNLVLLVVRYFSNDNKLHQGQVIIHKDLQDDIKKIFDLIKEKKFPVEKVIPIVKYNWDDEASMKDNNTSAFNYRYVKGTKRLSNHSYGRAIDINPWLNPYIKKNSVEPEGAEYNLDVQGTMTEDSFLVKEFLKLGWTWGGSWEKGQDYQHFEKVE